MHDQAPPDYDEFLRGLHAAPFGMARRTAIGWNYVLVEEGEEEDWLLEGPLHLRGFSAEFGMATSRMRIGRAWIDGLAESLPAFPLRLAALLFPDSPPYGDDMSELLPADLEEGRFAALAGDLAHHLYWSGRFEPDFYRGQACAGFIAIAMDRGDRVFLTPELQTDYAVLDWENLHASHSLGRLFRSGRLEEMKARLVVNRDIEPVLDGLCRQWSAHTWLYPEYVELLRRLAAEDRADFRLAGVELRVGQGEGELVAGELGYAIGQTYTSLSGFHRRERREWNDLGKVQLHLLAARLRDRGFAFWNLGHPYMQYKLDLGARVLPRKEFLARWRPATKGPALDLS